MTEQMPRKLKKKRPKKSLVIQQNTMFLVNRTVEIEDQFDLSVYEDNKDIFWRTIAGIFVALALGWMVIRYKCSSKEPAPNLVQCCPKSLCKLISLCFISLFR